MKWKDWNNQLGELAAKAKTLLVDEEVLTESFTAEADGAANAGAVFQVFLGDEVEYRMNGQNASEHQFRQEYRASEKGWVRMLGGLRTKIAMGEVLNPKLLMAMVQPYLKEAVLERLTGEGEMPDDEMVIRNAVLRRVTRLNNLLPDTASIHDNQNFPLPSPSEHYGLQVQYEYSGVGGVAYGQGFAGIKTCWSFLTNFEQIESTVKEFADAFRPVVKICDRAKKGT